MNSRLFFISFFIFFAGIACICLLTALGEVTLRSKHSQKVARRASLPRVSRLVIKQPKSADPNIDKYRGQDIFMTIGGTIGEDNGFNIPLYFYSTKSRRTMYLTEESTTQVDPVYPMEKMVKIRVNVEDQFMKKTITGYLAANSACPVVQYPEEELGKRTELKMQYYWRIEENGDGIALVNRWQNENRYIMIIEKKENFPAQTVKIGPTTRTIPARTSFVFQAGWWTSKTYDQSRLLPIYLKN
jgi:hypothetical protein